jgi:hypothetical protein
MISIIELERIGLQGMVGGVAYLGRSERVKRMAGLFSGLWAAAYGSQALGNTQMICICVRGRHRFLHLQDL